MPEPHSFHPADTPKSNLYTSYPFTPSAFDLSSGMTQEGSSSSHSNGRRLPKEPVYADEKRALKEVDKMSGISLDHQSKPSMLSQNSYSTGGSFASYSTNATSLASDGYFRFPAFSPPVKPSPYSNRGSETRPYHSPYDATTYEQDSGYANGHDFQIQYNQYNRSGHTLEPIPPPPPPPPKPPNIKNLSSFDSKNPFDQMAHTQSPITVSPSTCSLNVV